MAKKRYRNLSESVVAGSNPGDEFEFDFSEFNEAALIEAGIIEPVSGSKKSDQEKEQ